MKPFWENGIKHCHAMNKIVAKKALETVRF